MQPIISSEEIVKLKNSSKIILIDARAGINAHESYTNKHLKGARYVDLNEDLSTVDSNPANGGRHPLPSFKKFSEVLSKLGISPKSHVIVYDDKNGSNAAARFWWMLSAIGHEKVQVLNGGLQAAVKAGFPTSAENDFFDTTEYPIFEWTLSLADINEVDKARNNSHNAIIDVRDKNRYDGITEPLDLIAGHIPGAINVPFSENLDEDGLFHSPQILSKKYNEILGAVKPQDTIVHCGSGVTACHTLLAMDYAGIPIPKLYIGSWSEWSRNGLPIATH